MDAIVDKGLIKAKKDSAMVGVSKYERTENDHYPTEAACTVAFYNFLKAQRLVQPDTVFYEPACGDGAISNVIEGFGHKVISSDLYPQMDAPVKDFLTTDFMIDHDHLSAPVVVTNPPYAMPYIDLFLDRMMDLVHNDGVVGALLMRNEVDCAISRRKFFRDNPYYFGKLVLNWRPRWVPGSTGSPRHNYAWYIFSTHAAKQPIIDYALKPKV